MRKFLFFISITAFCLAGCVDTVEDVTINTDGSGIYKTTIDMSGLFDMMQMAAMMDTSANKSLQQFADKNIDSTISFRSFTDTATSLTPEEKALLQNGTAKIVVNQEEKTFKITMNYPFKQMEDIEKILALQKSKRGFNPMGSSTMNKELGSSMGDESLPGADDLMDIHFKKGLIERKVDQKKLDDLKNSEELKDVQGAEQMLKEVNFTTVIHLPKAASSTKGEKLTVSDDKKTVRMNYTLFDLMKTPEKLEFKIEY